MKKDKFDYKTYEVAHYATNVKQELLWQLYQVYQQEYKNHINTYWNSFKQNKITHFSHLGSTKHINTQLNASYLQICLAQCCATLNQHISAIELKFNDFLTHSTIKDKELLHQLRSINSTHTWLNQENYYYKKINPSIITDDFGNNINLLELRQGLEQLEKVKKNTTDKALISEPPKDNINSILLAKINNEITENKEETKTKKYFLDLTNKKCMNDYGLEYSAKQKIVISKKTIKLSKKIFFNIIEKQRVCFPNTDKPKLILDNRVINYIPNKKSKVFNAWLSVSTLIARKNVLIPIKTHDYLNNASGILGNTIELNFNTLPYLIEKQKYKLKENEKKLSNKKNTQTNDSLNISQNEKPFKTGITKTNQLIRVLLNKKTVQNTNNYYDHHNIDLNEFKPYELAFDIGLSTLFATSDGELLGQHWLDKLLAYDKKLTTLLSDRQYIYSKTQDKNKKRKKKVVFNVRSPRYDALIKQLKGFIKTEINRVLNHYFENKINSLLNQSYYLKTVIIEKLHFNNPNLSKKLNRIIKNFGLKLFKDKLDILSKKYCFEVIEVNPAYSSQQCLNCDYVDEKNRKEQKRFKCICCGFTMHADIKAAKVLLKRFQQEAFKNCLNIYSKTSSVLTELKNLFEGKIKTLISCGVIARRKLMLLLYNNKNIFKNLVKLEKGFIKPTSEALGLKPVPDYKLLI